jgi:hypothetical protein
MTRSASVPTPAAAPYPAFVTALRTFKRHGLPAVIDSSALRKRFTGGVVTQLIASFSALNLVNDQNAPSDLLRRLVCAVDEGDWPAAVAEMLFGAYPETLLSSLSAATPAKLNQSLSEAFETVGVSDRRQIVGFLLGAARDAGLEISAYLNPPAGSRGKLYLGPADAGVPSQQESDQQAQLAAKLIEKFPEFDARWPDELKEDWFAQFKELVALVKPEDASK